MISTIVKTVGINTITRFWIDPYGYGFSADFNCITLQNFIQVSQKQFGIPVGVKANPDDWKRLFGSQTGCPEVSTIPLWWCPTNYEQNDQPDFANYHQVGGWTSPYLKFYAYEF